jgi:adenylosuccinate synthase
LTALVVTKLDILAGYERLPVCVAYRVDGAETAELPVDDLDRATPVYREVDGWREALGGARSLADLPPSARAYVEMIQREVGVPVCMVSIGAEREQTIVLSDPFAARAS